MKNASVLFLISFIISCSTHRLKSNHLGNLLNKVCLTSQGKGRVKRFEKQNLFSYESIQKPNQWWMSLTLPVIGEEILGVDWSDKEASFLGSFGQRINRELAESNDDISKLPWRLLVSKIFLFLSNQDYLDDLKVSTENNELLIEGYESTAKVEASMKFSDIDAEHKFYQRMSLSIKRAGQFGPNSTLLAVDLFINQCNNP